jgi:hypothetical protein
MDSKVEVKIFLCLTDFHAMKTYWGVAVSSTHSWPQYEEEVSGEFHAPAALPLG